MTIIETLEKAHVQTWWLPESVVIHEGPDHCFYRHGGRVSIVRFTPRPEELTQRLNEICERIGAGPALFTFFPHRHGDDVIDALKHAGFHLEKRHEARVVHVEQYNRIPPADIQVIRVQTFEEMKRIYSLRSQVFGDGAQESDEDIRRFLRDASGPNPRVRQFLAVDRHSGEPLSQAGMSLFPDLKLAFLFAGGTSESARGRGAYTALVAARVDYARSIGIEHVGLFAREDSSAPIVARQGFKHCGEMHYWSLNQA